MGQLGELFPGAKLRRDARDEEGTGQRFEPGPLDLDSGVVQIRPKSPPPHRDEDSEET